MSNIIINEHMNYMITVVRYNTGEILVGGLFCYIGLPQKEQFSSKKHDLLRYASKRMQQFVKFVRHF